MVIKLLRSIILVLVKLLVLEFWLQVHLVVSKIVKFVENLVLIVLQL
jgi:hypothetical protein